MSDTDSTLGSALITPEEAAQIMSERAGYKITPEYIKQLRYQGKIRATKQLTRTTLYERTEIDQAPLPKRRDQKRFSFESENIPNQEVKQPDRNNIRVENIQTWRELLGKIISEPHERQRVAKTAGINPITLIRWVNGTSKPRMDRLHLLVDALPLYRDQLTELIEKEYPKGLLDTVITEGNSLQIHPAFYARVLQSITSLPLSLRSHTVCLLILRQMLSQLDPYGLGLTVLIVECVSPGPSQKVRSLRTMLGRESIEESYHSKFQGQFLGVESICGYAIESAHTIVIQNNEDKTRMFPADHLTKTGSVMAHPLLMQASVAGCLYVSSVQENYFSDEKLDLIKQYSDLVTIAFEPQRYYPLEEIELGIMPSYEIQEPYLANLSEYVMKLLLQAQGEQRFLTKSQAESLALQKLEEDLLHAASSPYRSNALIEQMPNKSNLNQ